MTRCLTLQQCLAVKPAKIVGLAADHGGHELTEYLGLMLREAGAEVIDFGDRQLVPEDDYPDFVHVDNKDSSIFPVAIPNHAGKMQLALLHRPLFPGTRPEETASQGKSRMVDRDHESIWISYCPMPPKGLLPHRPGLFNSHHRLATPVSPWEKLKIGGGTPPILTRHGWMIIYHGVSKSAAPDKAGRELCYSAGVMVLSEKHPQYIRYQSPAPVLTPESPDEIRGTIANIVFPTGIDRRDDLGTPDRFDVYYGMADNRIGIARLDLPEHLPPGAVVDPPEATANALALKNPKP